MRKLVPLLLLIVATAALAQNRGHAVMPMPGRGNVSGNTVSGIVSSVSGSFVLLADGLVTIDITDAKVTGTIEPGALLVAMLKPGEVTANAPLPAAYVGVTRVAPVTLSGSVTAVDVPGSTLTLLGRTIKVTSQTGFSSLFPTFKALTLADILPGQFVTVEANVSGGALVAASVHVLSFDTPRLPTVVRGTVKSISNDAWVITAAGNRDVTVTVNASTKIVGDPKIGDTVEVIVDGNNVATAILKSPLPVSDGAYTVHLTGFVKRIGATEWIIGMGPVGSLAPDFLVQVNASTKIVGDPKVGDRVEVVGTNMAHSALTAVMITKL